MDVQSCKNVIKIGLESQKNWFGTRVHENDKICTNKCPLRLDFDAHSRTESQLALFQICSECDRIGGQRPSKLKPAGACGSKKYTRREV